MPNPLTSSRHHAWYRANRLRIGLAGIWLLMLPSSPSVLAAEDCDGLLDPADLPADAEIVTREASMQFNGLDFCMLVYQTGLQPDEVRAHYADLWSEARGELYPYPDELGGTGLMLAREENSRSVQIRGIETGSTVEMGLFWKPAANANPDTAGTPRIRGFDVHTDIQDKDGRLLNLEADIPPAQAADALIRHFEATGWTLERHEPAGSSPGRIEMRRAGGAALDIRLVSTPPTTSAAITVLEPPTQP